MWYIKHLVPNYHVLYKQLQRCIEISVYLKTLLILNKPLLDPITLINLYMPSHANDFHLIPPIFTSIMMSSQN